MDRRYLLALLFSVVILLIYPRYLQWLGLSPAKKIINESQPSLKEASLIPQIKHPRAAHIVSYKNRLYDILFTNEGGSVILLKQGDVTLYQAKPEEKGIFGVSLQQEERDLTQENFEIKPAEKNGLPPSFSYEKAGEYRMTKKFFVGSEKPTLVLEVELENLSGHERSFPLKLQYALDLNLHGPRDETSVKMARFSGVELQLIPERALRKKSFSNVAR